MSVWTQHRGETIKSSFFVMMTQKMGLETLMLPRDGDDVVVVAAAGEKLPFLLLLVLLLLLLLGGGVLILGGE